MTELQIALHHKTKPLKAGPPTCNTPRADFAYQVRSGAPKVIYVVRHGESVWNKAQADKQFYTMLSATDHPLNEDVGSRRRPARTPASESRRRAC